MFVLCAMMFCSLATMQQLISAVANEKRPDFFFILDCIPGLLCCSCLCTLGLVFLLLENGVISLSGFSRTIVFSNCVQVPLLRLGTSLVIAVNVLRFFWRVFQTRDQWHRLVHRPGESRYRVAMRALLYLSFVPVLLCLGFAEPDCILIIFNYCLM